MDKTQHTERYGRLLAALRQARIEAGLSQVEVALRLGTYASYVSKCESGERRIDVIELAEFCRVYKTGLKTFLDAAGVKSDQSLPAVRSLLRPIAEVVQRRRIRSVSQRIPGTPNSEAGMPKAAFMVGQQTPWMPLGAAETGQARALPARTVSAFQRQMRDRGIRRPTRGIAEDAGCARRSQNW